MGTSRPVLSFGLTPALQRTFIFDKFEMGGVNRARQIILSAAGKMVNAGMVMAQLGERSWVTGFNGGDSGRKLAADATARGVSTAFTEIDADTRICDTIVDMASGNVTELVEEAPPIPRERMDIFEMNALELISKCKAMAISGTVPPVLANQNIFAPFAQKASELGIPWVIDSHRADLLAVLKFKPLVAKMNRFELETTFGLDNDESSVWTGMRSLLKAGARNVLITDGPASAWLMVEGGGMWRLFPPMVEPVLNPIGSGDCVTGAMLVALVRGQDIKDAAAYGLACGSANVLTPIPASFEAASVEKLATEVQIEMC